MRFWPGLALLTCLAAAPVGAQTPSHTNIIGPRPSSSDLEQTADAPCADSGGSCRRDELARPRARSTGRGPGPTDHHGPQGAAGPPAGQAETGPEDPDRAAPPTATVDADLPDPVEHRATPVTPISVTVSGAVSLGAYEAGFLYYVAEVLKQNPGTSKLEVVTGASAGSLNGFILLLSLCGGEPEGPTDSLFWSTWGDVGFDNLFVPAETTPTGIFSRSAFEKTIARVRARWNAGLPTSCDVVFGVTATRLHPLPIHVGDDRLSLPRTREKFVVRIRGQGAGRPPRVTNYATPQKGLDQALLPLDDPNLDPFDVLSDVIIASTAVPVAFAPKPISHCMISPAGDGPAHVPPCTLANSRTDLFIDGGVFDNQPLGVAAQAVSRGLEHKPTGWRWRDAPTRRRGEVPPEVLFLSLDPEIQAWPGTQLETVGQPTDSVFAMIPHLLGAFVQSARSEELQHLIADNPELRDQIVLGQNQLPHSSGLLGAFFGFFERGFREYDFYVGMVDAHELIEQQSGGVMANTGLKRPEPAWSEAPPDPQWQPYFCVQSVLDGDAERLRACRGKGMGNTRILAQTSLDRLYDQCRRLTRQTPIPVVHHRHCRRAVQGAVPPRIEKLPEDQPEAWLRDDDEAQFEHMLRLLTLYEYHFRDLDLRPSEASEAGARIHERIIRVGDRLAEVTGDGGSAITTLARAGANAIVYVPPPELLYVVLGTSPEVGWSSTRLWGGDPSWLRAHAAATFEGLPALQSTTDGDVSLLLAVGLEAEPVFLNNGSFQLRFGARAGVLLSPTDKAFFGTCDLAQTGESASACSRLATQGLVSLSLYDRLRAQLVGTWLPPVRRGAHTFVVISPAIGIQFYGPF